MSYFFIIYKKFYGDENMSKQSFTIKNSEIKGRIIWGFNPVTRVKKSKKIYSRKNYKISKND